MRVSEQRNAVGQDHLDRTAAIIKKLGGRRRRAKGSETLDGTQRYAFVTMDGHLFALKARLGSRIGIVCGGIGHPVRVPKTAAEKAAVLRLEAVLPALHQPKPTDTVTLMANKIIEAAGRTVERRDFHQAGIADTDIDKHFDAAMTLARRIEPGLDAMAVTP